MEPNVQLSEPAARLLDVAAVVAPGWLRRTVSGTARRAGIDVDTTPRSAELDAAVAIWVASLFAELSDLLALDVDEQRSNPLTVFRRAIDGPTALLTAWEVPAPRVDRFAAEHFPSDVYGLGPASWSDVDPALHEPGITWSAWKAMTVLRRRRGEGLR